ncbi:MAG: hypothetical protein H6839_16780 [Planctomycetes bacterium]|nr:hypothetical protein [Planctomycetota bacterium]
MESWNKWEPISGLRPVMYLQKPHYDSEELVIWLEEDYAQKGKESPKLLRLGFKAPIAFRSADEGDLLQTLDLMAKQAPWPLFKVDDSRFIHWLFEESMTIREPKSLIHYAIATPNEIIDVIDSEEPAVSWVE